ncbi:hypothetical protein UlMin_031230 [Ulmus minor]
MDSKSSPPEISPEFPNSTGSFYYSSVSAPYPSQFSEIDASEETRALNFDIEKNTSVGVEGVDGGGSDGGSEGFVSGEEEFEPASERPIRVGVAYGETLEKVVGGEDINGTFVGSSEFSRLDSLRPIAKVSVDDDDGDEEDDDEYGVEDLRTGVLGVQELGESVGGENSLGVLGTGSEVLVAADTTKNEIFGESVKENGVTGAVEEGEVFESSKLDGVGSLVEESSVLEKQSEGTIMQDEKIVVEKEGEDFGGKESGFGSEIKGAAEVADGGSDQDNSAIAEPSPADYKSVEADRVNFTEGRDSVVEAVNVDVSSLGAAIVGDVEKINDSEIKGLDLPVGVNLDNKFDTIGSISEELVDEKALPVEPEAVENVVAESRDGGVDEQTAIASPDEIDSEKIPEREDGQEADSETKWKKLMTEIGGETEEVLSGDGVVKWDGSENSFVNNVPHLSQHESAEAKPLDNSDSTINDEVNELEGRESDESYEPESVEPSSTLNPEIRLENDDEVNNLVNEGDSAEGSGTDGETEDIAFGSSEAAKQFLEELERASGAGSHSGAESSHDHSQRIDGQIVTDSDEEVDTDEEGGGKELFDSAALAALLKAATGGSTDDGNITITTSDGSRLFSVERPAGLGSSLRSMKPAPRPSHSNLFTQSLTGGGDSENLSEEEKKRLEKFQQIRVKYLRLVHRLGVSTDESISRQVLYRLALASGRQTSQEYSVDAAKARALQLEAEGKDDLNFSFTILVLGKTGVGKSATINSIFGEEKTPIYAFGPSTTSVKEIVGTVDGIKIRVFDTPGLKSGAMEQGENRRILSSVKKVTKKCPPDIVLYVDRLDTQSRDLNDIPLLRTITSTLGSSIWRSVVVTLTHAASSPPDGPSGSPLNYELFVAQRSQIVSQTIGQAVGDLRVMSPSLMNPISLVENHPSCRKNRDGQKVLPNGQAWRSQLLLLCFSMKILSEASNLSKPQESVDQRKLFGFRVRSPPLPYLLSWLLQSRAHPKLSADQGGENGDSDIDLDDLSDSDGEEEDEYDQLPPFKPLRNSQIARLTREQKKAYLEEYEYRVKLLQKKQWREELKRMKEMKKRGGKVSAEEFGFAGEDDPENGTPAAVPVALPDMVLPPSFDGDTPAYRYRILEPTSQFLARPVLDTHGWDHDCGYDGVNLEHSLAIASRFPTAVSVQVTKDKKDFSLHLDSSVAAKHGDNGSSMVGFDIQNIGRQLAYIVRGETKFKNLKKNKTAAGVSVTFLGENVTTGFKVEDQIGLGKRVVLVGSSGIVKSQSESAYGANLEVRLREADFPIGQDQSTLGLSLVKWRGDLALGANFQSQFSVGRNYKMAVRAGLNNKMSGQVTVRTSSSEQLQIALVAVLPILRTIYKAIRPGVSDNYSLY